MGRPGSLAPCPIALDHGPGTTAAMGRQSEEPAGPLMWVTGRLVARLTRCGRSIAIQRDRSQRPGHTGPWPCSCWAAGSRRAGPGRHGGVDPGCSPARLVSGLSRIAVWEGIGPGPVRRRQAFSGRGSADRGPGPRWRRLRVPTVHPMASVGIRGQHQTRTRWNVRSGMAAIPRQEKLPGDPWKTPPPMKALAGRSSLQPPDPAHPVRAAAASSGLGLASSRGGRVVVHRCSGSVRAAQVLGVAA
jgi:hypothetical protein